VQCVYNGTTTTNTYASDGLRHRSVVGANTTDYVLDQTMQVRELLNGTVKATVLVGPRGPEYRRDDQAGTIRWYVYDGLGSVVGEVAPDGTLTRSQSFDVYGCVRTSSGAATTKHKFVGSLGHPSDDETGLIYMRARHHDPVCGRFVSEDPGRDAANWFAYCAGNPTNDVDANGRIAVFVAAALLSFIIGAVTAYLQGQPLWKCAVVGLLAAAATFAGFFGIAWGGSLAAGPPAV
jgi:RHS repeat-associated protein